MPGLGHHLGSGRASMDMTPMAARHRSPGVVATRVGPAAISQLSRPSTTGPLGADLACIDILVSAGSIVEIGEVDCARREPSRWRSNSALLADSAHALVRLIGSVGQDPRLGELGVPVLAVVLDEGDQRFHGLKLFISMPSPAIKRCCGCSASSNQPDLLARPPDRKLLSIEFTHRGLPFGDRREPAPHGR